jgi:ATP-binding cassette subfamily B protein
MNNKAYLSKSKYPLLRLLSYLKPHKRDYLLALLYSTLNKLFDIFPEILLGVAVNMVVSKQDSWIAQITGVSSIFVQLIILGVLTFIIWGFESYFQYLYSLKWRNLAQNIEHQLRTDVYDHIQTSSVEQIDKTSTGQLISTINDDINQMERFLEDGVNQIVQLVVSTIFVGIVFVIASPLITLFAIMPIPIIIAGAFYFQHKLASKFLNVRQKASEISTALQRNLLGMLTIKSYVAEKYESERINKASKNYQQANYDTIKISSMVTPVIRMFILTGFMFTLLIGGYQTISGSMSVGIFSMLIFLSQRLLWPFNNLATVTVDYQRVMASTARILDLLTWKPETQNIDKQNYQPLLKNENIEFRKLQFYYQKNRLIYNNLSLNIISGKTTAFVGESGSGKSTLIKLLCRFYEPQSGGIYLGNNNINSYCLDYWRKNIALVSQESFLFDGSIYENIIYGSFNNPKEEVIMASKMAGLHEIVMQMPDQYQTQVGQRGLLLSGGQNQRVSIARAILKDAPILILDEATAAVDNETELVIQRAIHEISKSKTIIVIAHRLSTIRHADMIHVMDNGKIAESGTHTELVDKKDKYCRLWDIQTGSIKIQK